MYWWLIIFIVVLVFIIVYSWFCVKNGALTSRILGLIESHESRGFKVKEILSKNENVKGVFSTSLYGDGKDKKFVKRYVSPLLDNICLLKKKFPKWSFRVYLDPSISKRTREKILNCGAEVYIMNKKSNGHEGSMWRFLPAGEDKPYIILDADDKLNLDDKRCYDTYWIYFIKDWLKSDETFFQHKLSLVNTISIPITAKYWGGKPYSIKNIENLMNRYCNEWYGADEAFLCKKIYPLFKSKGVYQTPINNDERWFYLSLFILLFIIFLILIEKIKLY